MSDIDARCTDSAVHSHDGGKTLCQYGQTFVYRHAFEWIAPRLNTGRAADRHWIAAGLNRYPGIVIGVYVQCGRRVIGLRWGRPGAVRKVPT